MKFAYADPPYPGMAKYYPEKTEVNHEDLVKDLMEKCPDGWALSTASTTLGLVLPLCPPKTRVMAWVKSFASWKPGQNPSYAWEPVLMFGGRRSAQRKSDLTISDWISCPITTKKGLVGAKPIPVLLWIFRCLGAEHGDELWDVFPGTGSAGKAWEIIQKQMVLA